MERLALRRLRYGAAGIFNPERTCPGLRTPGQPLSEFDQGEVARVVFAGEGHLVGEIDWRWVLDRRATSGDLLERHS